MMSKVTWQSSQKQWIALILLTHRNKGTVRNIFVLQGTNLPNLRGQLQQCSILVLISTSYNKKGTN
uniref:Uncharacterized protein n=1 Tax=Anguilla anguilla TaxID=7936 RepID=A0A0E9Q2J2_ANGAN